MSFGGSGNEGNSRNQTITETITNNTDNRMVVDNGSVGIGAGATGNTVNITDGGAIDAAFNFAKASDAKAAENYDNLLNTTDSALEGIFAFGSQASAAASRNYQSLLDSTNASLRDLLDSTNTNMTGMLSGIASTQNFIAETQSTAKGALDSRTITLLAGTGAALIAFALWRKK